MLRAVLPAFAAVLPVRAADSGQTTAPSQPAAVAVLEYAETTNGLLNSGISFSRQTQPFNREPEVARGRIFRGILNAGDPSNNVAFLWQRNAGKLRLDLNHNGDLTDDPAGVFSTSDDPSSPYQTFRNVRLQFSTPSGACPVLADLHFWDFGMEPSCSVELHSFWQGKVTLAGEDWQAGIVQNLSKPVEGCDGDYLLLRAWERRNEPFNANGNTFDAFQFCPKIFAGGHAYEVKWLPLRGGGFKPRLQFTEQTVALGELKVTGQYIRRLLLSGNNGYLVICDRPGQTVKVPVGGYFSPNVLLERNGVWASCNVNPWQMKTQFQVTTQAPTVLAAGGPLTNSVSVTRHNQDLQLNYTLIGAGGQQYRMLAQDSSHPPEYAVYKDGKQIDSGKFEFG